MKFLSILISVTLFSLYSLKAQPWLKYLPKTKSSEEITFYDVQKAFRKYWKDKEYEKGKGFKQFKRIENFMEPRVFPSGKLPYLNIWEEIQKKQKLKSTTSPANWTFIGPNDTPYQHNSSYKSGSGRLNTIAFHPTDSNILYVGAPSGGLWKTINGGQSWTTTTDQLSAIGISDIVIDHSNPSVLYVATGDGDHSDTYGIGILKSINGGTTWTVTGPPLVPDDYTYFRRLIMHPSNSDVMLTASNSGIIKTTNGWTNYSHPIDQGIFKDIEYCPTNPNIVYASKYSSLGNAKILKSTNGGDSFYEPTNGLKFTNEVQRIEIAVTEADGSIVYAVCNDLDNDGFYGLYKSTDYGENWITLYDYNDPINLLGWDISGNDVGGQGWYDLTLAVSNTDTNEIYVGGINVWRSLDCGSTWNIVGYWSIYPSVEYVHADHHFLGFNPHNNALYSGNDGGIYKTYDKGESWIDLSDGLEILQSYKIAISENDTNILLSGNQDNGTFMLDGATWTEVVGGDGMECFIDYNNSDIIYTSLYYGEFRKSTNRGDNFTSISPVGEEGGWITPIVMHPSMSNILYIGFNDVYRSINGGNNWEKISNFGLDLSNKLDNIEVYEKDTSYIYASAGDVIWRTTDGGDNWTNIKNSLPTYFISDIVISEDDSMELWVTYSGYSDIFKVYHSEDGGDNWINYSTGLPKVPVNCIINEKTSVKGLYVGTDIGVYYRDSSMSSWIDYSDNLPNVIVNDLEIDYNQNKIYAGTYGRGIWSSNTYRDIDASNITYYKNENIKIYPNPSKGKFNLIIELENISELILNIYNLHGSLIYKYTHGDINSMNIIEIELSDTENGIYFLEAIIDEFIYKEKLIKY